MKLIINPFSDCQHNIASEEFLSENIDGNIFLLYINNPAIIIGKNQNTYAEINQQFVEQNNINLVRRLSGGGAVYHDGGNLNFCFIMDKTDKSTDQLFKEFTAPVIDALAALGVKAEFSGRNDLTIDGKKFSGNAQWHRKNRSVIHGTMLYNSELSVLASALKVNEIKFIDKAVKSVRSRVTNIKPYMTDDFTMEQFVDSIVKNVQKHFDTFEEYHYSDADLAKIDQLVVTKYGTKEWNYGKSPKFSFSERFRYVKGTVEFNANVVAGKIENAKIFGDFFGVNPNLSDVEATLTNCEFSPSAIKKALEKVNIDNYIDGLTVDVFVNALFS